MNAPEVFWKATRPDGTDFRTGTINYADVLNTGTVVVPPSAQKREFVLCTKGILHAATTPDSTLVGGRWPCRLFEVTGEVVAGRDAEHPFKVGMVTMTVLREVEAWQALGPQGKECVALIERAGALTADDAQRLDAARAAAWEAAGGAERPMSKFADWQAARDAARATARRASWDAAGDAAVDAAYLAVKTTFELRASARAARDAAWDAGSALGVRDLIGQFGFAQAHYDLLTGPWRRMIGPLHADDAALDGAPC